MFTSFRVILEFKGPSGAVHSSGPSADSLIAAIQAACLTLRTDNATGYAVEAHHDKGVDTNLNVTNYMAELSEDAAEDLEASVWHLENACQESSHKGGSDFPPTTSPFNDDIATRGELADWMKAQGVRAYS